MRPALKFLRISIAVVFVWFGFLKLFDVSPVIDVIRGSMPWIIEVPIFYKLLALLEIGIGAGFFIPKIARIAAWVAVAHLAIASLSVLFSPQAFIGSFPLLSLIGEFVVKNLVLIAGSVVIAKNSG